MEDLGFSSNMCQEWQEQLTRKGTSALAVIMQPHVIGVSKPLSALHLRAYRQTASHCVLEKSCIQEATSFIFHSNGANYQKYSPSCRMTESLKTPLATCLFRLLTAGFERSRGSLTALRSNISLLTHKSELCGGAHPSQQDRKPACLGPCWRSRQNGQPDRP